ncbi:MAG: hypothetical protein B7Z47_06830, partial [Chthoniobacter sp. 12-60-6]
MKPFLCALLLSLSSLPAHAQAPTATEAAAGAQALMQRLFAENTTQEELQELLKEANKIGVPRQQII